MKSCEAASKDTDYKNLVGKYLTWSYRTLLTDWWPAIIWQVSFLVVQNKRGDTVHFQRHGEKIYIKTIFLSFFWKLFWENNFQNCSTYFQRRNIQLKDWTSLFVDYIFICQYSCFFNLFCLWSTFYLHLHLLTIVNLLFLHKYPVTKRKVPIRIRDNNIFIKILAEKYFHFQWGYQIIWTWI